MKYILKCYDYYLSDINYLIDSYGKVIIIALMVIMDVINLIFVVKIQSVVVQFHL